MQLEKKQIDWLQNNQHGMFIEQKKHRQKNSFNAFLLT